MGRGFLTVELFVGDHVVPVENAAVLIKDTNGNLIYEMITNENGLTEKVPLDAPDKNNIYDPNYKGAFFSVYDVEVPHTQGFRKVIIRNVQVFDTIASILPIQLHPNSKENLPEENTDEITIPIEHGIDLQRNLAYEEVIETSSTRNIHITEKVLANEVSIPEYITVHLGFPNATAKNVRVAFKDYIKNVASSEIYPIWEEAAIYANIYAQISFVLNRVYTVWYRCRGKDFDITNNTAFDQFFVEGRNIFENISQIVDSVFNKFVRRLGRKEPLFTSYCNGTTSQCAGLSQYGSQSLALKGYTPIEILKHYYPIDIQIVESTNFTSSNIGAFGGVALIEGSSSKDVRTMQVYLNRISGNYYIPSIPNPNGFFDQYTKNATIEFQKIGNLIPDGIIGSSTWYAITLYYVAVKELAELTSEGERLGISEIPPTASIRLTGRGEYVVELQFLLNFISKFYHSIPLVIQNGVYKEDTRKSVVAFQKEFGLTPDGIVGLGTWQKLYEVYHAIEDTVYIPPSVTPEIPSPQAPKYPGATLKLGSRGGDVSLMQNYLNAISKVYRSVPATVADGIFGSATQSSVEAFQRQFGLTADGIIGSVTWYKIINVYESLTISETPLFPGTSLRIGSRGNDVLLMQNYLNKISTSFPVISALAADGSFGVGTQASVVAFQSLFGLTPDGVIGRDTWNKIVYIYNTMSDITAPQYPGTALRTGSRGGNVLIMQQYLKVISDYYSSIPSLTADGIFGMGTQASVIAFQRQFKLAADGVIGKNTWNEIVSVYNMVASNTVVSTSALSVNSANYRGNNVDKLALLFALNRFKR